MLIHRKRNSRLKTQRSSETISDDLFHAFISLLLFPLNRGRRFAAYIVNYAVDAFDFVDDAVGDAAEQRVWQFCPVCGHEVAGDDCARVRRRSRKVRPSPITPTDLTGRNTAKA